MLVTIARGYATSVSSQRSRTHKMSRCSVPHGRPRPTDYVYRPCRRESLQRPCPPRHSIGPSSRAGLEHQIAAGAARLRCGVRGSPGGGEPSGSATYRVRVEKRLGSGAVFSGSADQISSLALDEQVAALSQDDRVVGMSGGNGAVDGRQPALEGRRQLGEFQRYHGQGDWHRGHRLGYRAARGSVESARTLARFPGRARRASRLTRRTRTATARTSRASSRAAAPAAGRTTAANTSAWRRAHTSSA